LSPREPLVVGVTGASGVVYARRLVEVLLEKGEEVLLAASAAGRRVIREEMPEAVNTETIFNFQGPARPRVFSERDLGAPFCSGSFRFRAMAIVPASMGTIGAVAGGISLNCIHRGAEVALKERRTLVVVPRETPLSVIHLENLLALARAGAVVLPPSPGFYGRPESIADQVDFVVSRILDQLGIENRLSPRWASQAESSRPEEQSRENEGPSSPWK
jgi:4-hydroxy-3-polyprenylbenzoate decarboxylase